MATRAPMAASAWLIALPMPLPPPVTSAILPSSSLTSSEIDEELFGVPGVDAGDVLGGKARQHATGTQLDDRLHLHRSHRHHRARPVDLAQHLQPQLLLQSGHRPQRFAGRVGQDRDRRRFDRQLVDHFAESRSGGLHQRSVGSKGDGQEERAARAGGQGKRLRLLHRGDLTRQHELHVSVAIGHPQLAVRRGLLADLLDGRLFEPHDGDHAARLLVRCLGHDPAALFDEQQRSLPRDRACGCQRGDLAEAVARRDADVLEPVALAPHLVCGPAHGHHAWLDDVGAVQFLDWAFKAQPANGHLQDLFGALEHLARRRVAVVKVLSHAGLLRALAREQQRDRACELYTHLRRVAPHVRPEPKPASKTWSPVFTRPSRIACSRANGIDALDVLPYSSMLIATRSRGRPIRRAAASMIRKFAWWGTHRSMSSSATPAFSQTSLACRMKMSTANLKTSGPTISM